MMSKPIPLSTPTMHGEGLAYIRQAFDTNWVSSLGPHVDAFQQEIAAYAGAADVRHSVPARRLFIWR